MKRYFYLCVLSLFGLMSLSAQPAGGFGGVQQQAKLETSQEWKDVNYVGDGKVFHTCDIYLPKQQKDSYPVVIHIYGSAWFSNNSKGMADLGTTVRSLLNAGYAVVCPNHRSSTDAQWPAQLHDIRAVVRFVRGEAKKYHFDPSFIATSGFSSGGHLASTMATTSGMKTATVGTVNLDLEGNLGQYTDQPSTINAACDWSGPVDLTAMDCGNHITMGENSPEDVLLKSKIDKEPDKYRSLGAVEYIDKNDPPVIIFHGEKDNVVPVCQGKKFYELLKAAGVRTEATYPAEGGHGGPAMYTAENLQKMVRFLDSVRTGVAYSGPKEDFVPNLMNQPGQQYPMVNSEGYVRFRVVAPEAQSVVVSLGLGGRGGTKLQKGSDGVWTGTTDGPMDPGFHYYHLTIDGGVFNDPGTHNYFGSCRWESGVEIPAPDQDFYALRTDIPHGTVQEVLYYSPSQGKMQTAMVYLPPTYGKLVGKGSKAKQERFPVLYLQHGWGENETSWSRQGHAGIIMDNLIAEGKVEPFIIVMAYGLTNDVKFGTIGSFTAKEFEAVLVDELVPFIDANYLTKADKWNRAMAGLSMGGIETKLITLRRPEVFGYWGLLSGGQYMPDEIKDPKAVRMIFESCGSKERPDGIRQSVDALKAAGYNAHGFISEGTAHEFLTWRRSLREMAPMLFK
jgi:acetyl esterase/lipase/enterochelin esterase-like enzyme